jgi:hypothetical protein
MLLMDQTTSPWKATENRALMLLVVDLRYAAVAGVAVAVAVAVGVVQYCVDENDAKVSRWNQKLPSRHIFHRHLISMTRLEDCAITKLKSRRLDESPDMVIW